MTEPTDASRSLDETVLNPAAGVGRHEQDSLLSKHDGDVLGESLGASKDLLTAALGRTHDHLDHVPVLAAALPDAARLEESRVRELALDHGFDGVPERLVIERDRQLFVAPDIARDASTDVETHRASSTESHGSIVSAEASREELKHRVRPGTHRFYLYFEVDRSTGQINVETSWLPDLEEVQRALTPLGFRRRADDGAYCVTLSNAQDLVGILRRATKALTCLLEEARL